MNSHILYPLLAARRRQLGLSQQDLASRAGLRREKVNRLESRHEDIGLEEFCRLLDAVGLELAVQDKQRGAKRPAAAPRSLPPGNFEQAALIDGAKARVLDWGKVPK
jgi:transcriptional regulator with XRE-family HTH domain